MVCTKKSKATPKRLSKVKTLRASKVAVNARAAPMKRKTISSFAQNVAGKSKRLATNSKAKPLQDEQAKSSKAEKEKAKAVAASLREKAKAKAMALKERHKAKVLREKQRAVAQKAKERERALAREERERRKAEALEAKEIEDAIKQVAQFEAEEAERKAKEEATEAERRIQDGAQAEHAASLRGQSVDVASESIAEKSELEDVGEPIAVSSYDAAALLDCAKKIVAERVTEKDEVV